MKKILIFNMIILMLLLIGLNSICEGAGRIGTFGDSITKGSGFTITIDDIEYNNLGSYRHQLINLLQIGGYEFDMVGLWGDEAGDAWFIGEEAKINDNNWMLADQFDFDHTGWGSATAEILVDYFIQINGAEILYPKPNPPGSVGIVHLGTNDSNVSPIEDTVGHIRRFIDYMYDYDPSISMVICQLIPITITAEKTLWNIQYNQALKELVEQEFEDRNNLLLVDLHTLLEDSWEILSDDEIHPNTVGYNLIGSKLYFELISIAEFVKGPDADNDGYGDNIDNCPDIANPGQEDSDNDTIGDVCDNCPDLANSGQSDCDSDGQGDACEPDFADNDGDGIDDTCDKCPNDAGNDTDGDGVCGDVDNCPENCNSNQLDADSDSIGDVCDDTSGCGGCGQPACEVSCDIDADGILNSDDNCPNNCNAQQLDADNDTIGDVCDETPGCGGCGIPTCETGC